jgi:hypothetical protein
MGCAKVSRRRRCDDDQSINGGWDGEVVRAGADLTPPSSPFPQTITVP